jgi:hypothetical protein
LTTSLAPELTSKLEHLPGRTTFDKLQQLSPTWIEALKFSPESQGALKQLVTPGSDSNKLLKSLREQYTHADYRGAAASYLQRQEAEPVQQVAGAASGVENSYKEWLRNNPTASKSEVGYKAWKDTLSIESQHMDFLQSAQAYSTPYRDPFFWGTSWPKMAEIEAIGALNYEKRYTVGSTGAEAKQHEENIKALNDILETLRGILYHVTAPGPTPIGIHG